MLKVTLLTCAIVAAQPLIDGARAGEAISASVPMMWTGHFVNVSRSPVAGSMVQPSPARHLGWNDGEGDPDIVGSIPADAAANPAKDTTGLLGMRALSLCSLPGFAEDKASDNLACGGARHNRWSLKAAAFNYDLSRVKPAFANAPKPYGTAWDALPASASRPPAP